jgi:hypothetical protein
MKRLRLLVGSQQEISGTVYGTIVAMGTLAAAGSQPGTDPWRLATAVAGTVLVLWIAHVYSHAMGETIASRRKLDRAELTDVGRREFWIPLAAAGPVAALVLGGLGVLGERTAISLAFAIGLATLFVEGVRYAGVEHLGGFARVIAVAVNVSLGLAIIALEVAISH